MGRTLFLVLQCGLLTLVGYNLITALWGWRTPAPPPSAGRRRLVAVIPAHDEASVVGSVVSDLVAAGGAEVWVVADRCRDDTAAVATAAGARVAERNSGGGGKGAALAWFLTQRPLESDEVLVVFDADNRVQAGVLAGIADEFAAGAEAVQVYVDASAPEESWVTLASALSYWAGNRMVSLARHNLGWSVDLAGTGMGMTPAALDAAGGFSDSLVEDRDLSVRLALAGIPVRWSHHLRVSDQKPASASVVVRQRARWAAGNREVVRRHLGALLSAGWRRRQWRHFDQALRLIQPGRTFVAAVTAVLAVAAVASGSRWLLPAPVWVGAALVQFLAPIPFLRRDRVPWSRVSRYPLLAGLALLWVPVQVASRRLRGWVRTPHR